MAGVARVAVGLLLAVGRAAVGRAAPASPAPARGPAPHRAWEDTEVPSGWRRTAEALGEDPDLACSGTKAVAAAVQAAYARLHRKAGGAPDAAERERLAERAMATACKRAWSAQWAVVGAPRPPAFARLRAPLPPAACHHRRLPPRRAAHTDVRCHGRAPTAALHGRG
jgi:hypothetical protein